MSRRKPNPAHSLSRFMKGIAFYYHDRGMPFKRARIRMIDHTLEECAKILNNEEEVPDEMLISMAKNMVYSLNQRGVKITKEIEKKYPQGNVVPESEVQSLRDIKSTKDAIDTFIKTYKGWSDTDGQ